MAAHSAFLFDIKLSIGLDLLANLSLINSTNKKM